MGTAKIYVDALPIEIEGAHRVVYLPDGSQHVLDTMDRPLFSSGPRSNVVIVMSYSRNESPDPKQMARFVVPAPVANPQRPPTPIELSKSHPPTETAIEPQEKAEEITQPMKKIPAFPTPAAPSPTPPAPSRSRKFIPTRSMRVEKLADLAGEVTGEIPLPNFTHTSTGQGSGSGQSVHRGSASRSE